MCGIAGKLYFDPARPVSPAVLDAMTDRLVHRGPDARGVYLDGATGLGHRRLSIIDLSTSANQPMVGPTGMVLTFNGEIYNFKALRQELRSFASEVASLLEDPDVSIEVNTTAIHHYLTLHYVPSPETAFVDDLGDAAVQAALALALSGQVTDDERLLNGARAALDFMAGLLRVAPYARFA